jgi:hypothetical protein
VQGCNGIGEEGAKYIAEAIEKNDVVEGYWLKRNQIGLAGLQAILSALRTNQSYGLLTAGARTQAKPMSRAERVVCRALQ